MAKKRVGATPEGGESIGERLARLRKEKGLTQVDLAQKLETSQSLVSKYERGDLLLHGELVVRLAGLLGISTDELLGAQKQKGAVPFVRDKRLLRRLYAIDRLSKRDREALVRTIDAFLTKVSDEERRSA